MALCVSTLSYAAKPEPIADRRNVASALYGAKATVTSADGTVSDASVLLGGSHASNSAVCITGTPGTFEVIFAQPEEINLIRLYPGNLAYTSYPSGECSPRSYTIERWNNGYYLPLAEAKDMPSYSASGALGEEQFCYEHAFEPIKAERLRITVTASGHSGRCASSPAPVPEVARATYLRAIEVYSAKIEKGLAVRFAEAVQGDFTLPVWRNQPEAVLALQCTRFNQLPARLTLCDQLSGKELLAWDFTLSAGPQKVAFPLADIPNGRYVVTIAPADESSPYKGYVHRMLRVDKQPKTPPPQGTINVSGMRVFPVDDFHFETLSGVKVTIHPAEAIEVSHRMGLGSGDQDSRSNNYMGKSPDGLYHFRFCERDDAGASHWFVSTSRDLKEWKTVPEEQSSFQIPHVRSPYARIPAEADKIKSARTPFEKARIRHFDKAKDAPFELGDVIIQWFPPYSWDVKSKGVPEWSTYPMLERDDEWLLLTDEPIFVERFDYPGDALENDIDCNDNFGTKYFLDDGKTLCYGKAGKLRVFPPVAVEYDNLAEAYRVMRVYYTHDGFNWQYEYFCPPDEKDPYGWQSYGYTAWRADKDFWIALNFAYDCGAQQIYPEVCYSHDGLIWERFEDRTPFVKNTPVNTWLFGMIFMDIWIPFIDDDGSWFLPCGVGRTNPHFYPNRSPKNPYTADEVRRSFGDRKLAEKWPFFKGIGGWQGLADSFNRYLTGNTSGVVHFRADGYFATRAGNDGGRLVSRPFTAPGNRLLLNYTGKMTVTLTDTDGKPLEGFTAELDGDQTAREVLWQNGSAALPDADFKAAFDLAPCAEVYCLRFVK